jgi:predicted enzyme related to lactoylglutathione lyase
MHGSVRAGEEIMSHTDQLPPPSTQANAAGGNRLARHGHVSYLEIPALDATRSARFYQAVFGWLIRDFESKRPAFDDLSGDLIGRWHTGRTPTREAGILPYIYVDGIDEVVRRVLEQGGEVVKPPYPEGDLWVATFRDPAGNLLGIWQFGPRRRQPAGATP